MSVSLYGSGQTVLQVVTGTIAQQVSTTSTSFVSANLTASITPQSTTSKILVIVSTPWETFTGGNTYGTIYRGGTNLGNSNGMAQVGAQGTWTQCAINYLDSPATTSSTTYTFYYRTTTNTGYVGGDSVLATITLLEISGS